LFADGSALDKTDKVNLTILQPSKPLSSLGIENFDTLLFNITEVNPLENSELNVAE
jgi:hypothetical protein